MARIVETQEFEAVSSLGIPYFVSTVSAGFPSPAEDYVEGRISLDRELVPHPACTFVLRVSGDSMLGAGIHDGDRLIVDRSLEPVDGRVVVAVIGGELLVKRIRRKGGCVWFEADPPRDVYPDIEVLEGGIECLVWGVVTCVLHEV